MIWDKDGAEIKLGDLIEVENTSLLRYAEWDIIGFEELPDSVKYISTNGNDCADLSSLYNWCVIKVTESISKGAPYGGSKTEPSVALPSGLHRISTLTILGKPKAMGRFKPSDVANKSCKSTRTEKVDPKTDRISVSIMNVNTVMENVSVIASVYKDLYEKEKQSERTR